MPSSQRWSDAADALRRLTTRAPIAARSLLEDSTVHK